VVGLFIVQDGNMVRVFPPRTSCRMNSVPHCHSLLFRILYHSNNPTSHERNATFFCHWDATHYMGSVPIPLYSGGVISSRSRDGWRETHTLSGPRHADGTTTTTFEGTHSPTQGGHRDNNTTGVCTISHNYYCLRDLSY